MDLELTPPPPGPVLFKLRVGSGGWPGVQSESGRVGWVGLEYNVANSTAGSISGIYGSLSRLYSTNLAIPHKDPRQVGLVL